MDLENNKLTKEKKMSWIEIIVVLFFTGYYIIPAFDMSIVIITMLFVAYAVFVFGCDEKVGGLFWSSLGLCLWISIMVAVLTDSTAISEDVTNRDFKVFFSKFHQLYSMIFPIFLLVRVQKKTNEKQKKFLLITILLIMVYVMAVTIREIEINPRITRTWSGFGESAKKNVASYYFIYAVPLIIGTLVLCFNRIKNVALKILLIITMVYCFYFLVKAVYTLALLIAFIGLAIGLLKSTKSNVLRLAIISLTAVLLIFMGDILNFIAPKIGSDEMATRLTEVANFFTSGDATGYNLNGRLTLYWKSVVAFLKSPIWGNRRLDFNGHATFLTILADTGILGGIPFYYLYFNIRKKAKDLVNDKEGLFDIPFIIVLLIGFTNPIEAATPLKLTLCFVCPLMISLIYEKGRMENEKMGN